MKESVFAQGTDSLDVFRQLVETPDDFLGMLAYSLYKRHKIEWLQAHPQDNHQAFKKVACTPQQIGMYRSQAEQMAKNFIDITLEALGEEMRNTIMTNEVMTRMNQIEPNLSGKIDQLKPPFLQGHRQPLSRRCLLSNRSGDHLRFLHPLLEIPE